MALKVKIIKEVRNPKASDIFEPLKEKDRPRAITAEDIYNKLLELPGDYNTISLGLLFHPRAMEFNEAQGSDFKKAVIHLGKIICEKHWNPDKRMIFQECEELDHTGINMLTMSIQRAQNRRKKK